MDERIEEAYQQEVKFQMQMLNNLKRWLRNMMILSSVALSLILFGANLHQAFRFIGIITLVLSLVVMLLLGWIIKKGTNNVGLLLGRKTAKVFKKNC